MRWYRIAALAILTVVASGPASPTPPTPPMPAPSAPMDSPVFAAVAWDSATGAFGIACAAGAIASGARIPFAAWNAGAIARLGPGPIAGADEALASLAAGASPDSALRLLRARMPDPESMQSLIVGRNGATAVFSGARLSAWRGARGARGFACAGYGLSGSGTLGAMETAFRAPGDDDLGTRLLAALAAGNEASGEALRDRGGDASAALLVVRGGAEPGGRSDRLTDLRVDRSEDPVAELSRLYVRHAETFLAGAHVRFGDAARRVGDEAGARREYGQAEAAFRSAVARAPKDADALNELAWFLATRGAGGAEAVRFAEAAVAARGDDPNLLDTLAEAAYRAGNLERAIEAAERAVRVARGNARYEDRLRAFRAAKAGITGTVRGGTPADTSATR